MPVSRRRRGRWLTQALPSSASLPSQTMPSISSDRAALCAGCGGKISDRYYLLAVDKQCSRLSGNRGSPSTPCAVSETEAFGANICRCSRPQTFDWSDLARSGLGVQALAWPSRKETPFGSLHLAPRAQPQIASSSPQTSLGARGADTAQVAGPEVTFRRPRRWGAREKLLCSGSRTSGPSGLPASSPSSVRPSLLVSLDRGGFGLNPSFTQGL